MSGTLTKAAVLVEDVRQVLYRETANQTTGTTVTANATPFWSWQTGPTSCFDFTPRPRSIVSSLQ